MFPLDAQAKHHLVVLSLGVRQLKFLLFPAERHLRKPYHVVEDLHLHDIVMAVLEA